MKSSLLGSVLIIIVTITISLVNGQSGSNYFYKNRNGNSNNDEDNNEGGGDGNTNIKLLEENNSIPLEYLEQLDNVENMNDFFTRFVADDSTDPKLGIQHKIGNSNVERAASNIAKAAGCIPDSTVVPLEPLNPSNDPTVIYFPKCTRVKRCNGCCSSPLLSCQPVEVETIDFTIFKLQYTGKSRMPLKEQEHVLVEQHKKCKCDCRIKKEDCNSYQVYDAAQCKCNCTNYNARDKCLLEEDKIWDYETCKCRCRENQQCTTGTYFDDHLCKCTEVTGGSSSKAFFDRKRFIVKAVPVDPSNTTIYDTDGK
ncbi:uncharacterized protein LOC129944731 isoform X1 [Eupeodes corollae]|uniref:uncharacterized protein LOC129944731 isoform X1 n=1 Tax=Eupeodes corollae TaxID=290404 RepID=UPI00248F9197|nr:uncharacterized protein LOC129944731 isoform X1 [Eupeodes corollae]XP_055910347.1 uncharacterized protein LOC129944731 isoform X1 [Eupeodes corollae]XP_055910348.1 uncharacterized protein LOC129944731 isoform X1 [Eupeodes corollae]XP_055910349.1 uncharacterized protein LOC129944731 isoform X1 [Eupeodes corollae]XP_055910350.1 uncharacterized protein LOC129944731 isoform X1 [Eupeodes corollae]